MKKLYSLCLLGLAVASSSVMASSAVELGVVGAITPSACRVDLAGGCVVDYGAINPVEISLDDYTRLEDKEISFSVFCDSPARVGLTARDGRNGTVVSNSIWPNGVGRPPVKLTTYYAVGLGLDGDDKIGGYGIHVENNLVKVDGVDAGVMVRNADWDEDEFYGMSDFYAPIDRILTWTKPGELVPLAGQTVVGVIKVETYINKGSELDLSKPIALDGLTSLELVYL